MAVNQELGFGPDLVFTIRNLDLIALRILVGRHENLGGLMDGGIVLERELEPFGVQVKGHRQRNSGGLPGIRPYHGLQGPSARIRITWVLLLVGTE
jgi:hypothetical protein